MDRQPLVRIEDFVDGPFPCLVCNEVLRFEPESEAEHCEFLYRMEGLALVIYGRPKPLPSQQQ